MNEYDYIIIGGGCSGLSLAIHIAKKEPHKRLLILESRFVYENDRTWSFWDVDPHPFENQIHHTWGQWKVRYQDCELILNSRNYRYCTIPSDSFYKAAMKKMSLLSNLTLLMDCQVASLVESSSNVMIETNKGSYTSPKVFDSRPIKTKTSLYQHFLGWEVLSERPVFDSQAVMLMDFDIDQSKGLNFMYVLPFSSTEALIESTFISPDIHDDQIYEEAISGYLEERFQLSGYQILRKERGILPLRTTIHDEISSKVIPIGAKAGWARASTGYAFLPIQKAIENLAFHQQKGKSFNLDTYLDQIFLAFLYDQPQSAPEVFFELFRKNSPERLIRFLTGNWSFVDLVQVLFSMPKISMIKQALRVTTKDGI
jgi:lycopene beta-cyclase